MMSERQPRRGSAFTLIHLLAILPLVGFMLGLVMWGLRAQISTDRRILVQADRQAIMRSILNQLRADLVEAERIEFEKPRADQPVQLLQSVDGKVLSSPQRFNLSSQGAAIGIDLLQ